MSCQKKLLEFSYLYETFISTKYLSYLIVPQSKLEDTPDHSSPVHSDASTSGLISPAVRLLLETYHLNPMLIPATGPKGILLKGDVLRYVAQGGKPFTKPEEIAGVPVKKAAPKKAPPIPQPTAPPQAAKSAAQTTGV